MSADAILVTGGAGYIGSHVVKDLAENGFYPIVLDNLSTGNRQAVLAGDFFEGDMSDPKVLQQIFNSYKIKAIVHFAAFIEVEESVKNPVKYYQNNFINSLYFINQCVNHHINRFVFSSTAAVYGIPQTLPVSENSPLSPINPYGRSKMFTEMALADISKAFPDFHYLALRYFNVAGADAKIRIGQDYKNPTHLITRSLKTALGHFSHLDVFGTDYPTEDGTAVRDYIHVDDLARAHIQALKHLLAHPQNNVYNCGYGRGFTVFEVVRTVKEVTGIDFKVINRSRRAGDPPSLVALTDKIRQELNWKPRYDDLSYIIRTAWEWEKKLALRDSSVGRNI